MSMTQKEIKELIESDEQRLKETLDGYKYDKEYQSIGEEIKELTKRRAELERRQIEIKLEYMRDSKDEIEFAREELNYSRDLLKKATSGLDPADYNDDLQKMFDKYHYGSTYHDYRFLQWVSDDGNYALFKVNSHSAYLDRGSRSVGASARWDLFVIEEDFHMNRGSLDKNSKNCIWSKNGGRWGEKRDMELVEQAIKEYESNK